MTTANEGRAIKEILHDYPSEIVDPAVHHYQQEQLMKTIVQQKEKIAQTQKDAISKERELSLKLRQAIQKLNLKIQMQQTT